MAFNRITDREKIAETLRAYMRNATSQPAPFLATIKQRGGAEWNGLLVGAGGHISRGHALWAAR